VSTAAAGSAGAGDPEPRLPVAAVAGRLGVAPATLRTWDRRYGLGPTRHSAGEHRRYSPADVARLDLLHRLVLAGVPPAEAARIARQPALPASPANPGQSQPDPGQVCRSWRWRPGWPSTGSACGCSAAGCQPRRWPPQAPVGLTVLARQLYAAAFHGGPAPAGLPVTDAPGLDPATRWLAAVHLGALGHYGVAADLLRPGGRSVSSLADSTRASHLRQLSRPAEAEALDRLALAAAGPGEPAARADALIGLVADAVGLGRLTLARRRLNRAAAALAADPSWRTAVRLNWVRAEVALLGDRPADAVAAAAAALDGARTADAPRHVTKSLLILGAAIDVQEGASAAVPLLQAAAMCADARGWLPLVWPSRLLLARLLHSSDNPGASHERRAAGSAICAMRWGLPAAETATLLARPEIRPLVGRTTVSARVPPTRSPVRITVGTTQSQTRG
jgi:hypothetical protein